jgi:hypothetical protein
MSSFLDETKKASEIAKQTQMNKSAKIAFAGHFSNLLNFINFNKQVEDMRRFYPREYIDGAMSQIQIR